jgi:membrane-associated phospholipid phosphatase
MMFFWSRITVLGDVIVTLPAAAAIVIWLCSGQAWRVTAWWIGLFGTGMAIVVATKIAFIGWGVGISSVDFTGISGHAMRASAVLPVLGYLITQNASARAQRAGILSGFAFGVLITVSRVMVGAHSTSEAVTGEILGSLVAFAFIAIAGQMVTPAVNRWLVGASAAGLVWMSSGEPAPTQELLTEFALVLSGHEYPFTRADWAPLKRAENQFPNTFN